MKRLNTIVLLAGILSFAPVFTFALGTWELVLGGLNNPRGLAFGPEGALYVAEAGTGGAGPCAPSPTAPAGPLRCYGPTASIMRIDVESKTGERIATGLPSLAVPSGLEAGGIPDISFQGRGNGFFLVGLVGDAAVRAAYAPHDTTLGHKGRLLPNGKVTIEEDIAGFEFEHDPDGGGVDSNPYGILALPGKQIVADAGANALLEVKQNGRISVLATFADRLVPSPFPGGAPIAMDAVPTSVALGPDGAYYVGQLTGFPFPVGGANIYRVPAEGGTPQVWATGFTNIIDLAFGDGVLYVLQISKNGLRSGNPIGALIQVDPTNPNGPRIELVEGILTRPGGVTVAPDGTLYVTNRSTFPGTGEVLRIIP